MKLTWTNTEWDNFSGVASQDNLLMLNAGDDFLNASGETKNFNEYYKGDESSVRAMLAGEKISTSENLEFLESKKKFYEAGKLELETNINGIKINQAQKAFNSKAYTDRGKYVSQLWSVDKTIELINKRIDEVKVILEKRAIKEKADAEAKAKAQSDADAKAKADADKAKMKSLTDQLITAKTPEDRARIQAEIDALAGNVANTTGSSKLIVYAVAGLAIIGVAYMLLKRKA